MDRDAHLYTPKQISIHSLRMEGDSGDPVNVERKGISIHSLRMEGDLLSQVVSLPYLDFNPLPPYGGRLMTRITVFAHRLISIHSLRMEGDLESRHWSSKH